MVVNRKSIQKREIFQMFERFERKKIYDQISLSVVEPFEGNRIFLCMNENENEMQCNMETNT